MVVGSRLLRMTVSCGALLIASGCEQTFQLQLQKAELCSDSQAICLGSRQIRAFNGILTDVGEMSLEQGQTADASGFFHVKLLNHVSGRSGYIKLRYHFGTLDVERDESKTSYDHLCFDHSLPACALVNLPNGNTATNCDSTIRVFDGTTATMVGSTAAAPLGRACTADMSLYEITGPAGPVAEPEMDHYYQGCKCRFSQVGLNSPNVSSYFRNTMTTDSWFRTAMPAANCSQSAAIFAEDIAECRVFP